MKANQAIKIDRTEGRHHRVGVEITKDNCIYIEYENAIDFKNAKTSTIVDVNHYVFQIGFHFYRNEIIEEKKQIQSKFFYFEGSGEEVEKQIRGLLLKKKPRRYSISEFTGISFYGIQNGGFENGLWTEFWHKTPEKLEEDEKIELKWQEVLLP